MKQPEPQEEHRWLERLVGDWTWETEAPVEPGKPPQKWTGTERVRSLGGLWVQGEGQGPTPDGKQATTLITLGYDPQRKRFVGTWLGSMMTYLWVYEGELDASGRTLSLACEGPSMSGDGKMARYKDVIELVSDDQRTLSGHVQGDDGTWKQIMTTTYRRKR